MGKRGETRRKIYEVITRWLAEEGYAPSVRQIAREVGLSSTQTVQRHLDELEREGRIRREGVGNRKQIQASSPGLNLLPEEGIPVPLVGRVAAGEPILADQNIEQVVPVPAFLLGSGRHFMLQVRGDSMIGDGILDGDYVIVRQQEEAADGQIVVALIEEEATVKRLYREPNGIRLQPSNPAMEPIRTRSATIVGRVVSVLRRVD